MLKRSEFSSAKCMVGVDEKTQKRNSTLNIHISHINMQKYAFFTNVNKLSNLNFQNKRFCKAHIVNIIVEINAVSVLFLRIVSMRFISRFGECYF